MGLGGRHVTELHLQLFLGYKLQALGLEVWGVGAGAILKLRFLAWGL